MAKRHQATDEEIDNLMETLAGQLNEIGQTVRNLSAVVERVKETEPEGREEDEK